MHGMQTIRDAKSLAPRRTMEVAWLTSRTVSEDLGRDARDPPDCAPALLRFRVDSAARSWVTCAAVSIEEVGLAHLTALIAAISSFRSCGNESIVSFRSCELIDRQRSE